MNDSPGVTEKVRNSQLRLQKVDAMLSSPGEELGC